MPKEFGFENLRLCLDEYSADFLFIRLMGSMGGDVKVKEKLGDRVLDFRNDKSGLYMLIDSDEVFRFPLNSYDKGFSLAYERIGPDGSMVMLSHGIDPYDSDLPEPEMSTLRAVLDSHLMEIYFKGRIDIKFHSWWNKPHWKYWTINP